MATKKAKTTQIDETLELRRECRCGCGLRVISATARFRTGHDAKLKGQLLKAARAGSTEAVEELNALGWGHFLVETRAMKKAREQKAAELAEAAEAAD